MSVPCLEIHIVLTVCLQSSMSGCLVMPLDDKLEPGKLSTKHHASHGDQGCSRENCRPVAGSGRLCRLAQQPSWPQILPALAPLQPSEHPWRSVTPQKRS